MEEMLLDQPPVEDTLPAGVLFQSISGTYVGHRGSYRLELRVDLQEPAANNLYPALGLVSGDMFRDAGGGDWDHRGTFIVEHPYAKWGAVEAAIVGTMTYYHSMELAAAGGELAGKQVLRMTIPLHTAGETLLPATVHILHWGTYKTSFLCEKTSPFLRTIDLEIDRITSTELPKTVRTGELNVKPPDLPPLELDVPRAYQRAGIDMRIVSDSDIFAPSDAGSDLKWDEDELHNAMEHHFSQWRDEPQWKLYLLIATHFRLYPEYLVTGIMYDSQSRDPRDPFPRQGVAAFHSSMKSVKAWGSLPKAEFDRNFLRTCVHELGHALNLLHSFDKDRPESPSWMNYPWRYPYGYNLPPGWNGSNNYWQDCRFEFDLEELRHLRHHALLEVMPGGAGFGALGHDVAAPAAIPDTQQKAAPVALYVRTRPERYVFDFAEPVTVELKLKNQTKAPMIVPEMLNPEFGLMELHIRDPKGGVRPYRPLFKLCGEGRSKELPPGEKLYESVFIAFGADGFYFEEPGEYQIWAIYTAGGLRLRSNALRIRVAFPQKAEDEEIALRTFGQEQGHVLYMRGAGHLQKGNDELHEVADRYPTTHLARYIHYCFGNSRAREFKDVTTGQVRPVQLEEAVKQLSQASTLLRSTKRSALDNITHGRAVDLLYDCYKQLEEPYEAEVVLSKTVRYFKRMEVKPTVINDLQGRIDVLQEE